jgi:hypothetical protein
MPAQPLAYRVEVRLPDPKRRDGVSTERDDNPGVSTSDDAGLPNSVLATWLRAPAAFERNLMKAGGTKTKALRRLDIAHQVENVSGVRCREDAAQRQGAEKSHLRGWGPGRLAERRRVPGWRWRRRQVGLIIAGFVQEVRGISTSTDEPPVIGLQVVE